MATYNPNPYDPTEPTALRFVESAAAEFRALKTLVNAEISGGQYAGDWASLVGAFAAGRTVSHASTIWYLLVPLADVTASEPGVTLDWLDLGGVKRSGDTMTGHLNVPAGAVGAQAPQAQETVRLLGGAANLPTWTTAGRPGAPSTGFFGFNTTLSCLEFWDGTYWIQEGWQESLATLSGTSDIRTVPPWAREVHVGFVSASTNGTSPVTIRLVGAAGTEITSYFGMAGALITNTPGQATLLSSGFTLTTASAAAAYQGSARFTRMSTTHVWSGEGSFGRSDATSKHWFSGRKQLADGPIAGIEFTTEGGANTWDGGSAYVAWRH